ncbi:S8 family serine peptidase [Arenimonas sp. MALMAid1274]|uniref:S8 family serine peptidase n=1 Tax=Arenimonas sp. MALMAid1274 TaxID=3411630 RepID=UPI003B9E3A47
MRRMAVGADVVTTSQKLGRADAETLMRQIAANPNVEYVQIDRIMKHTLTPNDTNYSQQWGYTDADAGIRANTAWDVANGSGIIVAVLDTGYVAHSDLAANIVAGYDFISNTTTAGDGNGRDSDASDPGDYFGGDPSSWHGTHVAGTVAAVTNNAKGVAGTAWGAKVMPVRVLGRGGGSTSDIADAIIWASGGTVSGVPTLSAANAADVINMSLGGGGSCDATTQAAINSAVSRGTTVVVAAGNSNANASGFTPASCNNVVNVASVTSASARSSFSNYGTLIDVSAPGSSILSTLNSGTAGPGTENYVSYSGTSMASPHVAGAVALAQSRRLALGLALYTPAQIEASLKATAYPLSGACSGGCGAGIIDARALVDAAGGGGTNAPPVASFTFTTSGLTASFTDGSTDSNGTIASRSWNFGDGTTSTATNPSKTYSAAGTYTVTLTVTDNGGATNTTTRSVTVSSGGGGGSVLSNGVPVTGLSAATGASVNYTINVPTGASNLVISTSGGTGDADLYVRQGSAPTDTVYTCRPYLGGNNETCTIAAPVAGVYHVRVKAYAAYSGVSLVGSYTTGGGGGGTQTYSNTADYAIADNATVDSPISVSGRTGNGPSAASVSVNIVHTYKGDLKVDLVAPDGTLYNIHNRTGGGTDNVISTTSHNLTSEALNGTWRLRVNDNASGDTGYINSWTITF